MVREKKTPQQEEEAELDRALFFLPSHEAEEIRAFRKSLKSLGREGKARRYLEKRDDLLRRHAGLDLLFGCYWPLFKQDRSCHKQQDEAWEEFESQSREAHKRIKCVLTIASIWGKEVVLYYRLFSEGRRYCDKIRTVAKAFPRWEKATAVLNYAIHQRLQKRDLDKRTPEGRKGVNPIENYDLDLIKGIVDRVANNSSRLPEDLSLPLSKIPQGYHLDDYGLIVRDTVLPRQSVTHQDDNALALTASTPVPIPRNLSSKSASHLPNGPTGSNTKTPTSSSRPLFASAWLSALPLYKLEEGECIDDSIVNAYMYTISAEHPEICFLNSHFLNQYNGDMKKWRPEIGKHPLQADFVLMPVHENHHWYLLVMFKRAPVGINADGLTVCVLDSLGMTHEETFKCWENYLAVCGNKSRIQKIDVEVPQQINSIDCGIYMLGFVREFLQNPQQFTEAVDRGQHLDWEIHASALRQEIRAILVAARDATVNRDDTHTDSGHEDLGSDHGLVEIAGSPGDNIGNDGKDRKEGDNKESNSVVGPRVAPCSISPAASSKHTSPSAFVGEWAISLARLGRTDTGSAESFEIPFRNPSARTLVDQVSEPGKQIVEDRLFTFFTMLLDQEHIGRRALFKAVLRALERVDHNRPAEQVDLALRVATSGDGQVLEEASSTTAGRTKKRKHGMDAKGITMPTSKYPRNEVSGGTPDIQERHRIDISMEINGGSHHTLRTNTQPLEAECHNYWVSKLPDQDTQGIKPNNPHLGLQVSKGSVDSRAKGLCKPLLHVTVRNPERPVALAESGIGRVEIMLQQIQRYIDGRTSHFALSTSKLEAAEAEAFQSLRIMQDKLIYGVGILVQTPTPQAWKLIDEGCQMMGGVLRQQSRSIIRLLLRIFGGEGWDRFPELRTGLLKHFASISVVQLGPIHPLSVILHYLQDEYVLENVMERTFLILMDLLEKELDPADDEIRFLRVDLCFLLRERRNYAVAEQYGLRFLNEAECVFGRSHAITRGLLLKLGDVYLHQKLHGQALQVFNDLLIRGSDAQGNDSQITDIYAHRNLGWIHEELGNRAASEHHWKDVVKAAFTHWGPGTEKFAYFEAEAKESLRRQDFDCKTWMRSYYQS